MVDEESVNFFNGVEIDHVGDVGGFVADNIVFHVFDLLFFCVYIIPYSAVIKQRICGKVYVKFAAGWFINIDLT